MTGGREEVAQKPPSIPLDGFPIAELSVVDTLWRAHGSANTPGWFSSSGEGRFDLAAPSGTCYLADSMGAAIRERLGGAITPGGLVTQSDAEGMTVTEIAGLTGSYGDVSAQGAADFGVTSELTSMTPYTVPHEWAAAFSSYGLHGIRYTPRFTPGAVAWALFGQAGAHDVGTTFAALDGVTACGEAGLKILPGPPSASSLTVKKRPSR
ncbi:RES domain-containing protein [Microbacterium sp. ru370.1]|nr:RES domain-containing protein [Microbacterium sp. ru370.1]